MAWSKRRSESEDVGSELVSRQAWGSQRDMDTDQGLQYSTVLFHSRFSEGMINPGGQSVHWMKPMPLP
jgi:hypothetical protein